ncbi:helix-turn-helix domain-containing protein [Pedobacter sp.]|uniref:helix-turn-helix domain-containing protein n=1 Tax=Pedobacter sp. TaxID=1411316 RepID=UPI0031D0121F
MQIELNFITAFLIAVISQSIFAAFILFVSRNNQHPNRLLAALIVILALWLSDHFMRISGIYRQMPNLYFLPIFYSLAFGPLIWFYVRSLTNSNYKINQKELIHLVPVAFQALLYWVLAFSPYTTKYWFWEHIHKPYTYRLEFDGTWISMVIYLSLSLRLVKDYQIWLADHYSETSKIRLNWLKAVLLALIIVCLQWFIEVVLREFMGIYFNYDYSVQLLGLLILILGVAGLRQSSLAGIVYQPGKREDAAQPFQTDPLILERLINAMEHDRLFLNPTLTLAEMSAYLKLSPRLVSKHINQGLGLSFIDFVNRYRIDEVKRRLRAGDLTKLTLLAIAQESGFNSKSSFNRIFRDSEGIAPSDFPAN